MRTRQIQPKRRRQRSAARQVSRKSRRSAWVREWRERATRAASTTVQTLDPRVAQRRVAAATAKSHRQRFLILSSASTLALLLLVAVLLQTPIFSVRTITLSGSTHYLAADVQSAVDLDGRPLVSLPVAEIESQIEQMPWIASAEIQKVWPDEVRVAVTERVPVAVVPSAGGWYLVDATGRVLAQAVSRPNNLVALVDTNEISGPGSTLDARFAGALAAAALVPVELVSQIEGVVAGEDGSVLLALTSGLVVKMGEATNVPAKYQALLTVLAEVDEIQAVAEIDVRAADTPVVVPR